jgi:hypothetical protein
MTSVSIEFVFPGEGANIDGTIITPDMPVGAEPLPAFWNDRKDVS